MNEKIHFTIPYVCEKSCNNVKNIYKEINYTKECEKVVNEKYGFEDTIFTTSCTHALEMMAMNILY